MLSGRLAQFSFCPTSHHPLRLHTQAFSTSQNGTWKTERLNVKMGHSTLAAYLMHISLLSTRWRHFSHNCLQLKVNTQKKKLPKLLYKTQECNASGVLLSVNTESPFLHFFFCLFLTVLYCNCVKLKYAPCCVVSSLCPNDLICEKTTGPDTKSKRSVDLSLVRFSSEVCISVGVDRFPPPALPATPHPSSYTAYVSVHGKQQQVLLVN